ncbi:uncharacterized protein LOC118192746 [Stegodyphus dumicola]|uniref:uncharacterized protein LOC118192746 n=1 Tax=Stegodyphus dumicola TaxID=202533 RepID=UPI0015A85682|nr:uncharacterized protein LOC118192746 [Stegodyphus dumicola]
MRKRCQIVLLVLFGVLCSRRVSCTSAHNLQNLLKHPHYADGHQHGVQSQRTTSFPQRRTYEIGRPSYSPTYSAAPTAKFRESINEEGSSVGSFTRVSPVPKEYYKMNGYAIKSTSATKSSTVVDPRIPQELSEVREANEHFVRMRSRASCGVPRSQVICVRDIYPEKELLPRCTLLHRCTDAAGCCEDENLHCAPKAMQEVVLHFYVLGDDHRSSDVEKLWFVNHTECECQPKPTADVMTTTTTTTLSSLDENLVEQHPQRDEHNPKCRSCPSPFCVRQLGKGICSCDCFDRHKPCLRIKRGRDALSDIERRCVETGRCNVPDCEYGPFDPENGRCPRRPNYDADRRPDYDGPRWSESGRRPRPDIRNPEHRWKYLERD